MLIFIWKMMMLMKIYLIFFWDWEFYNKMFMVGVKSV